MNLRKNNIVRPKHIEILSKVIKAKFIDIDCLGICLWLFSQYEKMNLEVRKKYFEIVE